eukprot:g3394.t1
MADRPSFAQVPDYEKNAKTNRWKKLGDEANKLDSDAAVRFVDARAQRSRERMIAAQSIGIIREKLEDCAQKEGVNKFQKCKHLVKAYLDRIEYFNKIHGAYKI